MRILILCLAVALSACVASQAPAPQSPNLVRLDASFADSKWQGGLPSDEVCKKFNTRPGNAPSIKVSGLPAATATIELSFNDTTASNKVFDRGGHGIIHYQIPNPGAGEVVIPSFPGQTNQLPAGFSVKRNFTSQAWDSGRGYLPPCSGGRGHAYTVDIRALDAQGARLAETNLSLGMY
jgi:hypothetical protein